MSSRNTSPVSAAKPTSSPPSSNAARRPAGSIPQDTAEIATATAGPRPNTPSARPRWPYGNVLDTSDAPTTNAAPATPDTAPATTTIGRESASPSPNTDTAAARLTAGNITRAP